MVNIKTVVLVFCAVMLLFTGASAVKFVINDGDASLSLAATPNNEVAFSIVAADNPDSYSASMSASDSNGASASQESDITGADHIFSASAGISPDGDYAYTFTETAGGSTGTNQQAQASQGNSASATQKTTSIALAGASVVNATDSDSNTASQSVAFLLGINHVNLSSTTVSSASAFQNGIFAGIGANTLGITSAKNGDSSFTKACIAAGGMTFDNRATATGETTSASQDVILAGALGSAEAGSEDGDNNIASQMAGFVEGILVASQSTETSTSAVASQSGTFAGLGANTHGFAQSPDGDISRTNANVAAGAMTFDASSAAQDTSTTASQDVLLAGLLGSAHAGSVDQNGNRATQDALFGTGVLTTDQSTDTLGSANAAQAGDFAGLGATTNGFAWSSDGDISLTHAGVFTGLMTFDNAATAYDTNTTASQDVMEAGLLGQAGADSFDHGKIATQDAVFAAGVLNAAQTADTLDSASATQAGDFAGLGAFTAGFAISQEGDISQTDAGVFTGTMTFDDSAQAKDTNTTASQEVMLAGLFGSAHARSVDEGWNIATQDAVFAAGVLHADQTTDTLDSADALQTGDFAGAGALTTGFARAQDGDISHTTHGVLLGGTTFTNTATAADTTTDAGQNVDSAGLFGWAEAGSDDGNNVTHEGSAFVLGDLDVAQQAATGNSAGSRQVGIVSAAYGKTWGEALYDGQKSWTNADVVIGTMAFDSNSIADASTLSEQTIIISGIDGIPFAGAGSVSAGSDDGAGNVTGAGTGIVLGTLDVTQDANTSSSAHTTQSGSLSAALGTTWGDASSGAGKSWTDADVAVGTLTFDNHAVAGSSTSAGQTISMEALAGNASAGSDDGLGNVTGAGAGIVLGTLDVIQDANTSSSAHTTQSGSLSAALGTTWGDASSGAENSWTDAGVLIGSMTFDNNATAGYSTSADQHVQMGGVDGIPVAGAGSASAGSTDGSNTSLVGSDFILGVLDTTQGASSDPVGADQSGTMSAAAGNTSGEGSSGSKVAWTKAGVGVGTMAYSNFASTDPEPFVNQHVQIAGIDGVPVAGAGSAETGATDGTNTTRVGSEFILGVLEIDQHSDASSSAHSIQSGSLSAALGTTWGNATTGAQQSWTMADVVIGTMNFTNNYANANGHTEAGQAVDMAALFGNASVGSTDGPNTTEVGAGIILGTLNVNQDANTSASAHAFQNGDILAGYGYTWGNASSGAEQSWTSADVFIGTTTFDNSAAAGSSTSARQALNILGITGNASAGSTDGTNTTEVGTGFTLGDLDMTQEAWTGASAHATQNGTIIAVLGNSRGEATSGNEQSWTNGTVFIGMLTMDENTMSAGSSTSGLQNLYIAGLNGSAASGSTDGTNNATVGAEITGGNISALMEINWSEVSFDDIPGLVTEIVGDVGGGYIDVDQQVNTSASAHADQSGTVIALGDGRTWAEAASGADQRSWTAANVTTGVIVLNSNNASAGASTAADQDVFVIGLHGASAAGAADGTNSTEVGARFDGGGNVSSLNLDGLVNLIENPSLGNLTAWISGVGDIGVGYVSMDQQAGTSASANAGQIGKAGLGILPSGVYVANANGSTWATAGSGQARSWTMANVTSNNLFVPGIITTNSNAAYSGAAGTNASQNVKIAGLLLSPAAGSASGSSTDGTNNVTVGAKFANGTLTMDQRTSTGVSAYANQSGSVTAFYGTGSTWSEATSGDNRSWTTSDILSANALVYGKITVNSNKVFAGDTGTNASQNINIAGKDVLTGLLTFSTENGSAWAGSENGTNSAKVGSGFNNGQLTMNQQTNTTASAYANQSGTIDSYSTTLGGAWTHSEAANTSDGRLVYVDTKAASGSTITGAKGVRVTETSNAFSSHANVTAYEQKSTARIIFAISGGNPSSNTSAFAQNGGGSSIDTSTSGSTTATAWATTVNRYANV